MLKQPVPTMKRWLAGTATVAALALATAVSAWAAQPARTASGSGEIATDIGVRIDGGELRTLRGRYDLGEPMTFEFDDRGQRWKIDATVDRQPDGRYAISTALVRDGAVVATPKLVVAERAKAGIAMGDRLGDGGFKGIEIEMTVADADADAEVATSVAPAPAPAPQPQPQRRSAPTPSSDVTRTRTDAIAPMYRRISPPAYPAGDLRGRVMLELAVAADGRVAAVDVAAPSGHAALDAAAREAAARWQFEPARRGGEAVAARVRVPVDFLEADGVSAPVADADALEPIAVRRTAAAPAARVQGPAYRRLAPPAYPAGDLRGRVMLDVAVAEDGRVTQVAVAASSGHAALDEAARDAGGKWQFEAARRNGEPVAARVRVPVDFLDANEAQAPVVDDAALEAIAVRRTAAPPQG